MPAAHTHPLPDRRVCDQARKSRDPRFDGLFFTAVTSTKIYCRPICPAPSPKARHIRYYANAAAAEADGFRPCLRCRPELSPGDDRRRRAGDAVARALQLIQDGMLVEASLDALADRVGLGPRQLRRLFVDQIGAPPISVHTTQRLLFAKQLLTDTAMPVTDVAMASGFRSLRRFNAAFAQANRIAPTDLRRRPRTSASGALTLKLAYRPPYDFGALLSFLRTRALTGVESVDDASYARTFGSRRSPGWLCLRAWPDGGHALQLQLWGAPPAHLVDVVARVRRMFDLDANPGAIADVFRPDPLLGSSIRRAPGVRLPGGWDGFEIAVRAILGQQITVAAARTLAARIVARWGEALAPGPVPGLDHLFPTPAALAEADLRSVGLTASRAATVRGVAQAVLDGRVDFRADQTLGEFVARWTALPGIGDWTAHYIAMRALGEPDAFPAADLILRRAASGGRSPLSPTALTRRADAWRPWRAYAVIHLWRA